MGGVNACTLSGAGRALVTTAAMVALTGCAAGKPAGWQSGVGRDHPLVGRIFDVRAAGFVAEAALADDLARTGIVLLGEQHDNPGHHLLQGRLLDLLADRGRRPVVAFEMITTDETAAVARCAASRCRPSAFASAVRWNERGWPEWRIYEPVFDAARANRLPVVPASLPRTHTTEIAAGTAHTSGDARLLDLLRARPLDAGSRSALETEIREAHCGHAPEHALPAMVKVQRIRDAFMADSLAAAQTAGSAVLIAGAAHVRTDRGAPFYLDVLLPLTSRRSLAFVEVRDGLDTPAAYAALLHAERLPFDYVWFTPRVDDADPCEKFKQELERLRGRAPS